MLTFELEVVLALEEGRRAGAGVAAFVSVVLVVEGEIHDGYRAELLLVNHGLQAAAAHGIAVLQRLQCIIHHQSISHLIVVKLKSENAVKKKQYQVAALYYKNRCRQKVPIGNNVRGTKRTEAISDGSIRSSSGSVSVTKERQSLACV
jgi:hypothetical protein